jgi:phosphinothricin acetyltransferase
MILRPALESDIEAIAAIYGFHVLHGTGTFEIEPPNAAEMRQRWMNVTDRGLPYLVAEAERQVVGFAYAAPFRLRDAYRYTVEDSVYVHHEHGRKGIGESLLTAVIKDCELSGCRQMLALIGDSRNLASIRVHQKCGFRHVGTMQDVGLKLGGWLDVVIMQRALA